MSIIGIGVDICSIKRVEEAIRRTPRFTQRVLSNEELQHANASDANYVAKRWAAKEAFSKAMGKGMMIGFHNITIRHEPSGKPYVECSAIIDSSFAHLSLSDDGDNVIAFVVLSGS